MVSRHCAHLLNRGLKYNVLYGDRLTNHLPMALIALDQLGASQTHLNRFYQAYVGRLQPLACSVPSTGTSAAQSMPAEAPGQLLLYRDEYLAQLNQRGVKQTLNQALIPLLPGIAASGFHCLIRLSYAVEAEHPQEIAYALAFWKAHFLSLGPLKGKVDAPLWKLIRSISHTVRRHRFGAGNTVDRMKEVTTIAAFAALDNQPQCLSMASLADCAVRLYQSSRDFTMLHGITGSHALQVILPYCRDQELALRYYWQGLLVAYLSTGAVPLNSGDVSLPLSPWHELLERCSHSYNDHQIKLCYSCWQLSKAFDNLRYQQVASAIAADD